MDYVHDFNRDGWPDVLKINFEGVYLYINPRGELRHWDEYRVVAGVAAETTQLADVDGDGHPELIMSQGRGARKPDQLCEGGFVRPDQAVDDPPCFRKTRVGPHGMGYGDVNGDGRVDILQARGWWEQPPVGTECLWKYHPAEFGGGEPTGMERPFAGGADMFVYGSMAMACRMWSQAVPHMDGDWRGLSKRGVGPARFPGGNIWSPAIL